MEACCGAHHLGRVLSAQGHTLRLMTPEYVRPYVKAQKNDDRDAEAIAEKQRASHIDPPASSYAIIHDPEGRRRFRSMHEYRRA